MQLIRKRDKFVRYISLVLITDSEKMCIETIKHFSRHLIIDSSIMKKFMDYPMVDKMDKSIFQHRLLRIAGILLMPIDDFDRRLAFQFLLRDSALQAMFLKYSALFVRDNREFDRGLASTRSIYGNSVS